MCHISLFSRNWLNCFSPHKYKQLRMLARCTVSVPRCFWNIARGRIHPLFYLLVSDWMIVTGTCPTSHSVRFELADTQHNSCKLGQFGCLSRFHKSRLCGEMGEDEYHVHVLCVSVLYVNLHQSLYLWPECCKLLNQLWKIVPSTFKPSQRAKQNHITMSRYPVRSILNHVW